MDHLFVPFCESTEIYYAPHLIGTSTTCVKVRTPVRKNYITSQKLARNMRSCTPSYPHIVYPEEKQLKNERQRPTELSPAGKKTGSQFPSLHSLAPASLVLSPQERVSELLPAESRRVSLSHIHTPCLRLS